MTFESINEALSSGMMKPDDARALIIDKDHLQRIRYFVRLSDIRKEQMKDSQLQELNAIVNILQTLYTSTAGSPITDSDYDTLEEMLVDMGVPRLTGSVEINSANKVEHTFKTMRGTLDKVYSLTPDEVVANKSRKSLDSWIASISAKYFQSTGDRLDFNTVPVTLTPKFDGASCILEITNAKPLWLTRGDTGVNKASDVSHIMKVFNDVWATSDENMAIKFEVMCSEESKDSINEFYRLHPYHNSRQIVTATLNANEPDFKVDYLYPVPLRVIREGELVEQIHPKMFSDFPTAVCLLGDREVIRNFAYSHKYVITTSGHHLRTDGVVITITDPEIQKILGRDNDINNFEVAYKFTEETAYTTVKDVEFYASAFGYITPVLVTNDIILKGNTINHISLSNKERFDELGLHYGDQVKILYDIIPYATIDDRCKRVRNGRLVEFIKNCPSCSSELDLDTNVVQCKNPNCPSRIVGRILNYCANIRIQNIGTSTIEALMDEGLLKNGIRSLYKLRNKRIEMELIPGFGKIKTRKIISEIEAKRRLKDYEFFGALGIESLSTKTFKSIFENVKLNDVLDMIKVKNYDKLFIELISIQGIGEAKAKSLVDYLKDSKNAKELEKLLEEVSLIQTFGISKESNGRIVFSGIRPDNDTERLLINNHYEVSDSWSNSAKYLVVPRNDYTSSKVSNAKAKGIPIIALNGRSMIDAIVQDIPGMKVR